MSAINLDQIPFVEILASARNLIAAARSAEAWRGTHLAGIKGLSLEITLAAFVVEARALFLEEEFPLSTVRKSTPWAAPTSANGRRRHLAAIALRDIVIDLEKGGWMLRLKKRAPERSRLPIRLMSRVSATLFEYRDLERRSKDGPSPREKKILQVLSQEQPLTGMQIARRIERSHDHTRHVLADMLEKGLLQKTHGGYKSV